jgi:hypothetical protein
LLLRADGTVWGVTTNGFGNAFGQLGNGSTSDPGPFKPVQVQGLPPAKAIYAGDFYSLAILADGSLYLWGLPPDRGLESHRREDMSPPVFTPIKVSELSQLKKIAASEHILGLDAAGKGFVWGLGSKAGQRGRLKPGRAPWMDSYVALAANRFHSLGVGADGRVYAWGQNFREQLGVDRLQYSYEWLPVRDPLNPAYTQNAVPVVEFRNDTIGTGHYFITAYPDEVLALDAGTFVKGWQRTGRAWRAWLDQAEAPANAKPVFRFFSSRWNSHFYTGEDAERQKLQNNNPTNDPAIDWALESTAFYALPATSNCPSVSVLPRSTYLCAVAATPAVVDCPVGYYPVYRAFDVGPTSPRTDPNHRFTSNWIDTYRDVRFFGFVYEGIGFCAPASSQSGGDLHAYHDYPGDAVDTGAPLQSQFWFNNAGPGDASGATIVAALPSGGAWSVECIAYQRAQCPGDLRPSVLRNGVVVPALPAGGLLQLIARGTAPATPQTLDFASAIGAPSGAPDPYALNNAAALSKTIVRTPVQCTVVLSPGALSVGAEGVSTDVAVEVPDTCAWTVRSDQPWVVAAPAGGTGRGISS